MLHLSSEVHILPACIRLDVLHVLLVSQAGNCELFLAKHGMHVHHVCKICAVS